MKRSFYCLVLIALIMSACAKSRKKDEEGRKAQDAQVPDASAEESLEDAGDRSNKRGASGNRGTNGNRGTTVTTIAVGDAGGTRALIPPIDICGNGIVEGDEKCDDGNLDSQDGCTVRCEWTCIVDDDCDDLNDCNGKEVCTVDHICEDFAPDLENGSPCGKDKLCWFGACVATVCGDGWISGDEVCDDGNLDPNDGCTPDCELTCVDDLDCTNNNPCLDAVCRNDDLHGGLKVCVDETQLEDRTNCEIVNSKIKALCGDSDIEQDGWCINGVCTCKGCGDGETNGIEECDDGLLNGTVESPSNCSSDCRVVG